MDAQNLTKYKTTIYDEDDEGPDGEIPNVLPQGNLTVPEIYELRTRPRARFELVCLELDVPATSWMPEDTITELRMWGGDLAQSLDRRYHCYTHPNDQSLQFPMDYAAETVGKLYVKLSQAVEDLADLRARTNKKTGPYDEITAQIKYYEKVRDTLAGLDDEFRSFSIT